VVSAPRPSTGPTEPGLPAISWPQRAQRRLSPDAPFFLHRQRLLDALYTARSHIRGRVLDVGCFDRPYEQDFAAQTERWIGLDYPSYATYRTRADVFGAANRLPLREESVDTVLCTQVLDDLPEPGRLFAEAARVLRPSGALVLSAGQYSPPHNEPHDYYRVSRFALADLAARAGLHTACLIPQGGVVALVAFVLATWVPWLRSGGGWRHAMGGAWQRLAVAADERIIRHGDTIGWVLVATKAG
jgi:SAM-dependent methyltransferase